MNAKRGRRRPFEEPARLPGQSLRAELDDVISRAQLFGIYAVVAVAFAGVEWWRWYAATPPQPWAYTLIAIVVLAYSIPKIRELLIHARNLSLGEAGEVRVADLLDELKRLGYFVVHDVPCGDFNVDSVVIGTTGIFVIEVKARSKVDPKSVVRYDGTSILVDGLRPDRDPIIQARAAASWVKEFVHDHAGKSLRPRPIVIFPGWYIDGSSKGREVWVLNGKGLQVWIVREPKVLTDQDVAHISTCLSKHRA